MTKKEKARQLYIQSFDELTLPQIARKVGVDRSNLHKICKNEDWASQRNVYWKAKDKETTSNALSNAEFGKHPNTTETTKPKELIPLATLGKLDAQFEQLDKAWYKYTAIAFHQLKSEIVKELRSVENMTAKERSLLIRDLAVINQQEVIIYGAPPQREKSSTEEIEYVCEFGK